MPPKPPAPPPRTIQRATVSRIPPPPVRPAAVSPRAIQLAAPRPPAPHVQAAIQAASARGGAKLPAVPVHAGAAQAKPGSRFPQAPPPVVQAKFSGPGALALNRGAAITGGSKTSDPFQGAKYAEWTLGILKRIGFDSKIRDYVLAKAPKDQPQSQNDVAWLQCAYCEYYYPPDAVEVDHIENWAEYSLKMTEATSLSGAKAWEVYVGCNDPDNLVVSCKSCNGSKGDRTATQQWMNDRRNLAKQLGGFKCKTNYC